MSYPVEPPIKRKNQSPLRVMVNAWGCLLGLVMLALGGAVGLLGAIFVAPELLGFDLTATALAEHEIVLASTAVDLEQRAENAEASATSFFFEVEATRAIILNEYELLGQTATQSSQNISATETADAVESAQRQTQIALDYQATQAQLQENATDAEIDFRNTQAALGIITQVSPTETPATLVTASNPNDFRLGLDESIWQASNAEDWQQGANGLRAFQNNAWLLERETRLLPEGNFNLELVFEASEQTNSEYWFMIVSDESNLAVYLKADGTTIVEAAFYSFELATLESGALRVENSNLVSRMAARTTLGDSTSLELIREENWLRVSVNGQVLLLTELRALSNGRLGIQMPLGANLQTIEQE